MRTGTFRLAALLAGLLPLLLPAAGRAQGLIVGGSGAMHRSMAGASTAYGVDALGAQYWNPAVITTLPGSEVVIGGEFLLADTHVGSAINAGAFGPLGPPTTLSGYTRSDSGLGVLSGVAFVYKPDDSPISFGMMTATLAGGGVNFPGNPANPVLAPRGPFNNVILGPQAASLTIVSLMPTAAIQLTDRLAVGFTPMLDVSVVSFDPAFFGPTNDASGDGFRSFPTGSHTRPFWGAGFRVGATYQVCDGVHVGASYTSPQWFETWRFNASDEVGNPIRYQTRATLPQILSGGVSFTGVEGLVLSADLRWFDYSTSNLFGNSVREGGAGWDSIWAVALGGKYQLTERCSVQLGYLYNQNPVPADLALFNTMLPAVTEHTISAGTYVQATESIGMSLAYIHGFKNSVTGSVLQLNRTSVTLDTEYDSLAFGMHIKFGGKAPEQRPVSTAATIPTVPPACPAPGCPAPGCQPTYYPPTGYNQPAGPAPGMMLPQAVGTPVPTAGQPMLP